MSSKQVRWTSLTDGKTHRFLKGQISSTILIRAWTWICSKSSSLSRTSVFWITMKRIGRHARRLSRIRTYGLCMRKNGLPLRSRPSWSLWRAQVRVKDYRVDSDSNVDNRSITKELHLSIRNSGAKYKLPSGVRLPLQFMDGNDSHGRD